jgi:amino acid transporter
VQLAFDMTILDLLTLLSYIALNVDIVFQIKRIYQTKSSRDLSLTGMIIGYAAIVIILIKFIGLSDVPLIIGQGLIVLTFGTYFALALYYFANSNSRISG